LTAWQAKWRGVCTDGNQGVVSDGGKESFTAIADATADPPVSGQVQTVLQRFSQGPAANAQGHRFKKGGFLMKHYTCSMQVFQQFPTAGQPLTKKGKTTLCFFQGPA